MMKIEKFFKKRNLIVVVSIILIVMCGVIIGNKISSDKENEEIEDKEYYHFKDTNSTSYVPMTRRDYDFPVEEGAKLAKITLSWVSDFVDYNLYVYDSEGNEVGRSTHLNPYEYEEVKIEKFDNFGIYRAEVEYVTGNGEYNIEIYVHY